MKIYHRIGTWVMIGILILIILTTGILTKYMINDNGDWKEQLVKQNESIEESLTYNYVPKSQKDILKKDLAINNYRLEQDIPPIGEKTFWGFMNSTTGIISIITLFTIIVAATSVAGEFSWGTIKLLLIRPVNRSKILLSKYLSSLLFALTLLTLLFLFSLIFGSIIFGFDDLSQPYLTYTNGQVEGTSMLLHIISLYGYSAVDLLMMVTFAFMISSVFRSNALSIGLSIFLMFTGTQIVMLFSKYTWVKYILFANTNLMQYVDGVPIVEGMTMTFSIIMLAVYYAVFNFLSWFTFNKRDITA